MELLSFKTSLAVFLLAILLVDRCAEGRKRKQGNQDELDNFSGDSYTEFADKFYRNSASDLSSKKSGGNGRSTSGSGDRAPFDEDAEDDNDDDDDDDDQEDELGSGDFPTDFGGQPFATDDEDFYTKTSTTTTSPPIATTRSTSSVRRRTSTLSTTTTTTTLLNIDIDPEESDVTSFGSKFQTPTSKDDSPSFEGSGSGDFGDDEDYSDVGIPVSTTTTTTTTTTTESTTSSTTLSTTVTTRSTTRYTTRSTITTTASTTTTRITTAATTTATTLSSSSTIPSVQRTASSTTTAPTPSTTNRPLRTRPTVPARTSTERATTFSPDHNNTTDGKEAGPTVLVSNHILMIALYTALVLVLCLSILIAMCLLLRWRSTYMLANTSDEGSSSDSASSDLPIIKRSTKGQIVGANSSSEKSHYARRASPSSPPPLMPPDLSLDSKSTSFRHKRASGADTSATSSLGANKAKTKARKNNEWY